MAAETVAVGTKAVAYELKEALFEKPEAGDPELESRSQYFVWLAPWRGSVGNALDGYVLQTNSVFVVAAVSIVMTTWAIFEVKWTIVESMQVFIDIMTGITAVISLKVGYTGSVCLGGVIVAVMIVRFSTHSAICHICFYHANGYVLSSAHPHFHIPQYPWHHDAMHIFNAFISFLILTYYTLYFSHLLMATPEERLDGLKEVAKIRENRKLLGKGKRHWLVDLLSMDEVALYEDYKKGDLNSKS
jgi:hypothetical protein